ncbi:MAG TPA: amidohydrolase family protein [Thermoanaerobaculia bacterium]|nr:amidohydrolase family protein [Thermoanaerobaculia bacterium]
MKTTVLALLVLAAITRPSSAQETVAIAGETIYTMAGAPIQNGIVLVRNGKIERVGQASAIAVPAGARVINAKVVTPGLIDAHTVVGLAGYLNQPHDQDQLERTDAIQPELRAMDAYNPREELVAWLRGFGITTLHTGHAPAALISGQTMIVKTRGDTVDDATIRPEAMIAVTLGEDALGQNNKSPGTRPKEIAMLRSELIKAQEHGRKLSSGSEDRRPGRDLGLEMLGKVLRKEMPLLVTANRSRDILAALRVAKEFDISIILDGAAEAYHVIPQIREAGVPVILHATMARSNGDRENLSFETASILRKAGIPVALQSGFESYVPKTRVVLFEAAIAAANGLTFVEALSTITIDAARILGIANRVGSIEPGKDADIALFDGDPFEYTSHVTHVLIDGEVVSEEVR